MRATPELIRSSTAEPPLKPLGTLANQTGMGKWNKALKQGLVAAIVMAGVLMGSVEAVAECESYRNAKAFCEVGSVSAPHLIPSAVLSDYSHLMSLQETYFESLEAMRTANDQHVSPVLVNNKPVSDKRSIYRLCKTVLNHKLAARNFHGYQGRYCKQRAEVCDLRCGGKQKIACASMKVQAEWTIDMAGLHTDSDEIQALKNCMIENEIDDQILTASIPKASNKNGTSLPQQGPVPFSNPRAAR